MRRYYPPSKDRRDYIRRAAMAATPGPWKCDCGNGEVESEHPDHRRAPVCDRSDISERGRHYEYFQLETKPIYPDDDTEYIAAVDPQTVIWLLDRVDELERLLGVP